MIEKLSEKEARKFRRSRRNAISPSVSLRRHFVALARQVNDWRQASLSRPGSAMRLGVTSLSSGAGRSTVSFNLAVSLASLNRSQVLLVESDFGKHYVTRRLGYSRSSGLSELIAGEVELSDIIHPTPLARLSVVGSGQKSEQDAIELPFTDFAKPFDIQASEFGSIVFDLPMANHLTAFHAIAPHLDGVLLTVESNQIEPRLVERFRRQLDVQGVPIVGLVVNKS